MAILPDTFSVLYIRLIVHWDKTKYFLQLLKINLSSASQVIAAKVIIIVARMIQIR